MLLALVACGDPPGPRDILDADECGAWEEFFDELAGKLVGCERACQFKPPNQELCPNGPTCIAEGTIVVDGLLGCCSPLTRDPGSMSLDYYWGFLQCN